MKCTCGETMIETNEPTTFTKYEILVKNYTYKLCKSCGERWFNLDIIPVLHDAIQKNLKEVDFNDYSHIKKVNFTVVDDDNNSDNDTKVN